jgi:uncharacterized protein (DUF433 family)
METPLIIRDTNILGGIPVFYGTRVPAHTLIDYLTAGDTIDDFLEDFPTVTREQAVLFLELAGERMMAQTDAHSD